MVVDEGDVKELCARYPFLSDAQVQFYCAHRQAMHYYTVSDYAKWNQCSHETAPVSYTHLDVYKRQALDSTILMASFVPATASVIRLLLNSSTDGLMIYSPST